MADASSRKDFKSKCSTSRNMKKKTNTNLSKKDKKELDQEIKAEMAANASNAVDETYMSDYDIIDMAEVDTEFKHLNIGDENASQNLCIGCGVDMGRDNPRQYCRKTYCPCE